MIINVNSSSNDDNYTCNYVSVCMYIVIIVVNDWPVIMEPCSPLWRPVLLLLFMPEGPAEGSRALASITGQQTAPLEMKGGGGGPSKPPPPEAISMKGQCLPHGGLAGPGSCRRSIQDSSEKT